MADDWQVGDRFSCLVGPFRASFTVVRVRNAGAEVAWDSTAVLVGYGHQQYAPSGAVLTQDQAHGFVGRAHWGDSGYHPRDDG